MWLNLGELKNSGLEFAIDWKVFQQPRFGWSTNLNFSYYFDTELVKITSEIVDQDPTLYLGELGAPFLTGVQTILVEEGQPIGQIIAPIYVGIDSTGLLQYQMPSDTVNGIGSDPVQYEDYQTVGSGLPDFEIGWGNNFTFGKFSLSFFLRGVFGHSLINVNNARYGVPVVMGIQSGMNQALDFIDATNGPVYSNVHVEKADFVTLDNFSLGYQFDFAESKYVQNLRIYFSGQNLFTLTNYSGVSPEVRYGDSRDNYNPLAPGIDREDTYFRTRSFTLGASIAF
jgi:iron complex outermembrane receptor protein